MRRTKSDTWLMVLSLMVVLLGVFYAVYLASKPMEDVFKRAIGDADEVKVIQIDSKQDPMVALLLVNQNDLQIATLHKTKFSQVMVDQIFSEENKEIESQSLQEMQVVYALLEDRYYIATQLRSSRLQSVYLMFSRDSLAFDMDVRGSSVREVCAMLTCTKEIEVQTPLSWFSFAKNTREFLLVLGVDENNGVVSMFQLDHQQRE